MEKTDNPLVTIKNNGKRTAHIGRKVILPGKEATVAAALAESPSVKVLSEKGFLIISEVSAKDKKPAATKEKESALEDTSAKGTVLAG